MVSLKFVKFKIQALKFISISSSLGFVIGLAHPLIVSLLPALSMLIVSNWVMGQQLHDSNHNPIEHKLKDIEPILQAISGGMIIAAASNELLPMLGDMSESGNGKFTSTSTFFGASLGFIIAIGQIYLLASKDKLLLSCWTATATTTPGTTTGTCNKENENHPLGISRNINSGCGYGSSYGYSQSQGAGYVTAGNASTAETEPIFNRILSYINSAAHTSPQGGRYQSLSTASNHNTNNVIAHTPTVSVSASVSSCSSSSSSSSVGSEGGDVELEMHHSVSAGESDVSDTEGVSADASYSQHQQHWDSHSPHTTSHSHTTSHVTDTNTNTHTHSGVGINASVGEFTLKTLNLNLNSSELQKLQQMHDLVHSMHRKCVQLTSTSTSSSTSASMSTKMNKTDTSQRATHSAHEYEYLPLPVLPAPTTLPHIKRELQRQKQKQKHKDKYEFKQANNEREGDEEDGDTAKAAAPLSISAATDLADSLDENIHLLEYYVHHFRRVFYERDVKTTPITTSTNVTTTAAAASMAATPVPAVTLEHDNLFSGKRARLLSSGVDILLACSTDILGTFHQTMPHFPTNSNVNQHKNTHNKYTASMPPQTSVNMNMNTISAVANGKEEENAPSDPRPHSPTQCTSDALRNIGGNLRKMSRCIERIHSTVDTAADRFKFKRDRKAALLHPSCDDLSQLGVGMGEGESVGTFASSGLDELELGLALHTLPKDNKIPGSLVVPVIVDAAVDGFLIGLSTQLSTNTGIILALVTSIEMGALGGAFAFRVNRCTDSSKTMQYLTITAPSLVLVVFAYIGSIGGTASEDSPFLLSAFVGFAIVCLLELAIAELLIGAFESNAASTSFFMFFGFWLALALDLIVTSIRQ